MTLELECHQKIAVWNMTKVVYVFRERNRDSEWGSFRFDASFMKNRAYYLHMEIYVPYFRFGIEVTGVLGIEKKKVSALQMSY